MNAWIAPVKMFAYAVVLLVAVAICYAAYMSIAYWSGIGV